MGAGFYTLTISQARSSINYNDTTRASLMAQAGIADAIARMHELAYLKTEDPTDPWYTVNYCNNLATRASFAALHNGALPSAPRATRSISTGRGIGCL